MIPHRSCRTLPSFATAIHQRISEEEPPYVQLGPYHSFLRRDAEPLVPGEVAEVEFSLFATAARFRTGHRIRVAIAGHDASVFKRYPAEGTPVWKIYRSFDFPSSIKLPVRNSGIRVQ